MAAPPLYSTAPPGGPRQEVRPSHAMEGGGDGRLRRGLRRGGQGWASPGGRKGERGENRSPPRPHLPRFCNSSVSDSCAASSQCIMGQAPRPNRVCPPPAALLHTPFPRPCVPFPKHHMFCWSARCMSAFFTPQCNKMPWRQGRWSPSRRCQYTPRVPPTLVKRQTDPSHPARPPLAAHRQGPRGSALWRRLLPEPPSHLVLAPLCCVFHEHTTCCACTRAHRFAALLLSTLIPSWSRPPHKVSHELSVLQSGPLGLAMVPCSQPTPGVTVTALQGPRATLTSPLSTQPPSTLPSGSHRPLLATGVCQCRCSAWQREDTKSTSVKMNDYFPNESPALSISGLLSGRPVRLFYLWDVVHVNISM